jgi:RHS repeat-associated protein
MLAALDSSSGALTKTGYLPYGRSATVPASFGYTGQRADPETNGLYYFRARMYMPAWGRFMQPDPVGYKAGSHLYAYVGNDPLNFVDPLGLSQDSPNNPPVTSDVSPDPIQPGSQYAQAPLALCALGPLGCAAGAGLTAGQVTLGAAAVVGGAIILNARPPQNPQPITNPPQPAPDIPEGWVNSPTRSGGGTIYHPPEQSPPGSGESIRVMPPGSSPVPGLEGGYWVQTKGQQTHQNRPPVGGGFGESSYSRQRSSDTN